MAYLLVFRAHYIQDVVTGFLAPFFIEHVTSVLDLVEHQVNKPKSQYESVIVKHDNPVLHMFLVTIGGPFRITVITHFYFFKINFVKS
jgi:hypothetical protein